MKGLNVLYFLLACEGQICYSQKKEAVTYLLHNTAHRDSYTLYCIKRIHLNSSSFVQRRDKTRISVLWKKRKENNS
jgi:c-di-GMP-binding flagellar brake protein YcgR